MAENMVKNVSVEELLDWLNMANEGLSCHVISKKTGRSSSLISKYLERIRAEPLSLFLASAFKDARLVINEQKAMQKISELLLVEKERRNAKKNQLVFIGMADVAEFYWCASKSLFSNKEMEPAFFVSYLQDRIVYADMLDYVTELPANPEELLSIGGNIMFNDVEKLLKMRAKMLAEKQAKRSPPPIPILIPSENDGQLKGVALNPALPEEEKRRLVKGLAQAGVPTIDIDPRLRGRILEFYKRERYPTIRWNFEWESYVVVGVPDGITDAFVYEFKTTRNRFLMTYLKPVAFAQGDLYGHFFKREKKRVQIYIMEEGKTETWDVEANTVNALELLQKFKEMDEGKKFPPPREWKCKRCQFSAVCAR